QSDTTKSKPPACSLARATTPSSASSTLVKPSSLSRLRTMRRIVEKSSTTRNLILDGSAGIYFSRSISVRLQQQGAYGVRQQIAVELGDVGVDADAAPHGPIGLGRQRGVHDDGNPGETRVALD